MLTAVLCALLRHYGRDIDFEQHAGNRETGDDEKRIGGNRAAFAVLLAPAFGDIGLVTHVGNINDLLHDVSECAAVLG